MIDRRISDAWRATKVNNCSDECKHQAVATQYRDEVLINRFPYCGHGVLMHRHELAAYAYACICLFFVYFVVFVCLYLCMCVCVRACV